MFGGLLTLDTILKFGGGGCFIHSILPALTINYKPKPFVLCLLNIKFLITSSVTVVSYKVSIYISSYSF